MSESDDDRNGREHCISNVQVLAYPDGAILLIHKRCICEYCRGSVILSSIFDSFKDKVSVYWDEKQLPRSCRHYSSFIDYCQAHLFGLTSAVPCRKYAYFHRKFEKESRVRAHLAIFMNIPLQDNDAVFVGMEADGCTAEDQPLDPALVIKGSIPPPKSDRDEAIQVCYCPCSVLLQWNPDLPRSLPIINTFMLYVNVIH